MADISLKCTSCGEHTIVSEYIDPSMAECRVCGGELEVPYAESYAPQKAPETPGPAKPEATVFAATPRGEASADRMLARNKRKKRLKNKVIVWTPRRRTVWLIFFILAAVLTFLRFIVFNGDTQDSAVFKTFGILAMMILHFAVVVDGFRDNVMHGLLCLLMPFYSIYYVFFHSDSFLLRILVAGFGLAFGFDTAQWMVLTTVEFLRWLGASRLLNEGF